MRFTRDNIARVRRVLVLDKAEAVHELNVQDLAGAVLVKVVMDILLGS